MYRRAANFPLNCRVSVPDGSESPSHRDGLQLPTIPAKQPPNDIGNISAITSLAGRCLPVQKNRSDGITAGAIRKIECRLPQQTFARIERPLLSRRTWPLASRSATVATVSVVLLVQELTATIKSPRESFGRGLSICVFFMGIDEELEQIQCHFVQTRLHQGCWSA